MSEIALITQFAEDVEKGLSSSPKKLSSKYFYDARGDELFQQIMKLDEYYLTNAEKDVLETHADEMLELFDGERFRLIEFGAGDGLKTKILLRHFLENHANFTYRPIDISGNVLDQLVSDLETRWPELEINAVQDDYFRALDRLNHEDTSKKVILFMGSNIGNFSDSEAISFLHHIREFMNPGDLLMVGMDLKKDPSIILSAYNDKQGITREFNLNLLDRINRELGGHFNREKFLHYPTYNPVTGITASYLISLEDQTVAIDEIGTSFFFKAYEPILMEISRKYSIPDIENIANLAGFRVLQHFLDSNSLFVDSVWEIS